MKNTILFNFLFAYSLIANAQTPQAINYQAVARDNNGSPLNNKAIGVKISILSGSASGTIVYSETHNITTNQFGLFNIEIGRGNVQSGIFSQISWAINSYYAKIDIDQNGGTNYQFVGTSQLLSVPYALYAENVKNKDDADADSTNELQRLSITGNTLTISKGNSITLPTNTSGGLTPNGNCGTVTDIEGNVYQTVTIGSQCWMKENLKTKRYKDGASIPNLVSSTQWQTLSDGYCYYNNDSTNNIYGKLYNWRTVSEGKLCPTGWHSPSDTDWTRLINYLDGSNVAGGKMKSLQFWTYPNDGANNNSGFTSLPGGYRANNGVFAEIDVSSYFWSTGLLTTYVGYYRSQANDTPSVNRSYKNTNAGMSVRCVKD